MLELQHGIIDLLLGDLVEQSTDAIVNAANAELAGGGGVDGAIHRAAGPELLALCQAIPADAKGHRCAPGDVKTTPAAALPAKIVIHAVGPVYDPRAPERSHELLRQVHERALGAAVDRGCRSIAFPAISTGAYGFPIDEAAPIAIEAACSHLASPSSLELIRFVLYRPIQYDAFEAALRHWTRDAG